MLMAMRGAAELAATDAKPLIAQLHGTSVGCTCATRWRPRGKRCPMKKARGAQVSAAMMQRAVTDQDWVRRSQASRPKRKATEMKITPKTAPMTTRFLETRQVLLAMLPRPAKSRKLAMTTAAA